MSGLWIVINTRVWARQKVATLLSYTRHLLQEELAWQWCSQLWCRHLESLHNSIVLSHLLISLTPVWWSPVKLIKGRSYWLKMTSPLIIYMLYQLTTTFSITRILTYTVFCRGAWFRIYIFVFINYIVLPAGAVGNTPVIMIPVPLTLTSVHHLLADRGSKCSPVLDNSRSWICWTGVSRQGQIFHILRVHHHHRYLQLLEIEFSQQWDLAPFNWSNSDNS